MGDFRPSPRPVPEPTTRVRPLRWQRHIRDPIFAQLRQGITPEKIALTLAVGLALAVFPLLGSTTLLCFLAGWWLRLNQPVIQLVNWLAYPLQLLCLPGFVRFGEFLAQARRVPFSVPQLMAEFRASPGKFLQDFGLTGLHGIVGWLVVAPALGVLLYFGLLPVLRRAQRMTTPLPAA